MSNATQNDRDLVDSAVRALGEVSSGLQRRHDETLELLSGAKAKRREVIEGVMCAVVPNISKQTERQLEEQYPRFLSKDQGARDLLRDYRKVFGIFERKGTQQALLQLQAKLASHLEGLADKETGLLGFEGRSNGAVSELARANAVITQLEERLSKLSQSIDSAAEMSLAFTRQLIGNGAVPPAVRTHAEHVVRQHRAGPQVSSASGAAPRRGLPTGAGQSSTGFRSSPVSHHHQDDSDLWFYAMTDVPISMRTFMIDSFHDHYHQSHDMGTASSQLAYAPLIDGVTGAVDRDGAAVVDGVSAASFTEYAGGSNAGVCDPAETGGFTSQPFEGGNGADYTPQTFETGDSASVSCAVDSIATDDSLGAFS
jgi:hypothetical protein